MSTKKTLLALINMIYFVLFVFVVKRMVLLYDSFQQIFELTNKFNGHLQFCFLAVLVCLFMTNLIMIGEKK